MVDRWSEMPHSTKVALADIAAQLDRKALANVDKDTDHGRDGDEHNNMASDVGERGTDNDEGENVCSILPLLKEAWGCWKANLPWKNDTEDTVMETEVRNAVVGLGQEWERETMKTRERIKNGEEESARVREKNLNRLTRQWLRSEQERQHMYLREGPYIQLEESMRLYTALLQWLEMRGCEPIPFPPLDYGDDLQILHKALESLRNDLSSTREEELSMEERAELEMIESAYGDPQGALAMVKKALLAKRCFEPISVSLRDHLSHMTPIYSIHPLEKLTDTYLDMYLWHEAKKAQLFPSWVKPIDAEPLPLLVQHCCSALHQVIEERDSLLGESVVFVQSQLQNLYQNADLLLVKRVLRLVLDHNLADYMTARMDSVELHYKDMKVTNVLGLIRGVQFCSFVTQVYAIAFDVLLMGPTRAFELSGSLTSPRAVFFVGEGEKKDGSPVRMYCRVGDKIYYAVSFSGETADSLVDRFRCSFPESPPPTVEGEPLKAWAGSEDGCDGHKADLARAVFLTLANCLPGGLVGLNWKRSTVSVVNNDTDGGIHFAMEGFHARIPLHSYRGRDREIASHRETSAVVELSVSEQCLALLENDIRVMLMEDSLSAFTLVQRWNCAVLGFITYFREAAIQCSEVMEKLCVWQRKALDRIAVLLSCGAVWKLPLAAVFSSPEVGGLGMFNIDSSAQFESFCSPENSADTLTIPSIASYVSLWSEQLGHDSSPSQRKTATTRSCGWRIRSLFTHYHSKHEQYVEESQSPWEKCSYASDISSLLGGHERTLRLSLADAAGLSSWHDIEPVEVHPQAREITLSDAQFLLWWSPLLRKGTLPLISIEGGSLAVHSPMPVLEEQLLALLNDTQHSLIHQGILDGLLCALQNTLHEDMTASLLDDESVISLQGKKDVLFCSEVSLLKETADSFPGTAKQFLIALEMSWALRGVSLDRHCAERLHERSNFSNGREILVMVDLSSFCFTACGPWAPGLQNSLIAAMADVLATNFSLIHFKNAVAAMLRPHTIETEPLTIRNQGALFGRDLAWLVDECSVSHCGTSDGSQTSHFVAIFSPKTGETMFLSLPSPLDVRDEFLSSWLSWKAAGVIVAFLGTLQETERPKDIVFMSNALCHHVETLLNTSFGIQLRRSRLRLPLNSFGMVDCIRTRLRDSHFPTVTTVGLYGDWLTSISSYTAFCRLLYILRAVEWSHNSARKILWDSAETPLASASLWPPFLTTKWIAAEYSLRDLIVAEYCRRTHSDPGALSSAQIQHIIVAGSRH